MFKEALEAQDASLIHMRIMGQKYLMVGMVATEEMFILGQQAACQVCTT